MSRKAIVLPWAESQLLKAAIWWSENRSPEQALRWLNGFEAAIASLETDTRRLTTAPEDALFDFSFAVRQLTYGLGNRRMHRAIVELRESVVHIHAIRYLAQD